MSLRGVTRRIGLVLSLALFCSATGLRAQEVSVTLLGTGSPTPALDRFGPSTLVQAGTQTLLFDVGRGALQRLARTGTSYGQLDAVFLTHLHSDHIVGIPDLWLIGWLLSGRDRPLKVYGPAGTAKMMDHLKQAFEVDLRVRVQENAPSLPAAGGEIQVTEVEPGVVYENNGVRVTAILVDHRAISPAFGYRVDYAGRSVVLSGDTQFSPNLVKAAAGADLLIHEVYDAPDQYLSHNPRAAQVRTFHTLASEAGTVFRQVHPKLAVYSHIVLRGGITAQDLVTRTRTTYSGPLVVGEDLMKFVVGQDIAIVRP